MQSLKVCLIFTKYPPGALIRQFHKTSLMRKRNSRVFNDAGIQRSKALYENEEEQLLHLQENEESEEMDFTQAHLAYDEHISEKKRMRKRLEYKIMQQKFFKEGKQPQMLTFAERECMKYLHNEDPIRWNVHTLSESFPATPDVVRKILKSKLVLSLEEQQRKAKVVQKNWQLLAEGKLKAAPKVIEHFKKFINKRENLLEQLKNPNFFLPEIKNEPVWNNGEMNNILNQYEKKIKELEDEHFNENKNALTDKNVECKENEDEKSSTDCLNEEINKIRPFKDLRQKETFLLRKMVKTYSEPVTLEELERSIEKKNESNETLSIYEKSILESKLGERQVKNYESLSDCIKEPGNIQVSRLSMKEKKKEKWEQIFKNETSVKIKAVDEMNEFDNEAELNKREELKTKMHYLTENEPDDYPMPDDRTLVISPLEVGKLLNMEDGKKVELLKKEVVHEKVAKPVALDAESERLENLFYEKEAEDIKDTPFWNSGSSNREKLVLESQKAPLESPKEISKVTKADVSSNDYYPERITIPKSKQGTGLTFKVKDCYYDDDGEFLYRVPGMTN